MKLRTLVAGLLFVAVMGSGAAFAFWRSSGSGSATATAASLETVTVEAFVAGDTPTSRLLPGGPAADVIIRVHNPNPFSVKVVSVTADGAATPDAGHPGCSTPAVTFTDQTGVSLNVGAHATRLLHLAGAASMGSSASAGCQGATFAIPVTMEAVR